MSWHKHDVMPLGLNELSHFVELVEIDNDLLVKLAPEFEEHIEGSLNYCRINLGLNFGNVCHGFV